MSLSPGPHWIGSFQDILTHFATEDPLEEVWAQIGRFATTSYLNNLTPDNIAVPWSGTCQ
jgi:hypothetical protein